MIAFISDIHGNYEALKRVLSDIDSLKINEIYCLGDVVGYYSQVNECCNELRLRDIPCIMGNHDWYLVSGTQCERSKSVNDCLAYQKEILSLENFEWILHNPVIRRERNISMVHGGWRNPLDEYLHPDETYFDSIDGEFYVSGHSHIARIDDFKKKKYCNPGSVGQPRDNENTASYAVFDGEQFYLRRVEYDIQLVCELMNEAGFNPYYYGCLKDGSKHLHK